MALPVALMMYRGLDPQDAHQLPRTAVSSGQLDTRRGKTGVPVWVPLPAPVVGALAAESRHPTMTLTLCAIAMASHGRSQATARHGAQFVRSSKRMARCSQVLR